MRRVFLATVGVTAALLLVHVPSAAAAPGGVEVSFDGVNFSSSASGALFTTISHLVPGDSDEATFYLRNSASEPGFLRITLRDVTTSNTDFADALTLSARTHGHTGAPTTLLVANPCWVLLEGQIVVPGEVVRVTTSLALGQLQGLAGQGATATAALGVALSSTAVQLPPTDCGQSETVLPVVLQPPTRPATSTATGSTGAVGDANASISPTKPSSPEADLPVLNLPQLLGIDPNTWHLFEEYLILVPIGASIIGGSAFGIVAWRRRKNDDQLEIAA